ncbi:MAG TPA: substrate-binding domain-containing protein [Bacteroidota bacterium]
MKACSWRYFLLAILAVSCQSGQEETATSGHLRLLIAESVAPVIEQEVTEFMNLYGPRGADVTYTIVNAYEANKRFINDTVRAIVTTIPLTAAEKNLVSKTTEHLAEIVLAYDGVVGIVHRQNPREKLTLDQIRGILTGRFTSWEQLGRVKTTQGTIHLVLEDSSDVALYLSQRILGGKTTFSGHRESRSPRETLERVGNDPLALGFVGLNWVESAGTSVKVLTLAADSATADTAFKPPAESIGNFYSPHPAHLYLNYYPMKRAITIYARTTPGDFATGFASFLASPAGQKIFLDRGLLPATQKIVLRRPE